MYTQYTQRGFMSTLEQFKEWLSTQNEGYLTEPMNSKHDAMYRAFIAGQQSKGE